MNKVTTVVQPVGYDYSRLFDAEFASTVASGRASLVREHYRSAENFDYQYILPKKSGMLEYVKISDDIVVLMSDFAHACQGRTVQSTSDGDWLHVQFRLSGGGREGLETDQMVATPSGSCATIRSPAGCSIIRDFDAGERWKALCLYMRPQVIGSYFEIPPSVFCDEFRWVSDPGSMPLRADIMPLPAGAIRVVNDMFACPYSGDLRRTFMRAKVLELFVSVASRFCQAPAEAADGARPASPADHEKVDAVIRIMREEIDAPLSLKALARRVALNRTRLAEVFRDCTGSTVQSFWRELRLARAQQLLEDEKLPVTEVAARVGYANTSSLTRAFTKHYGILPKDMRRRR